MRLSNIIVILLSIQITGLADTLKVPADYPTIQDAIDAAADGGTVLVASGTYVENINFIGKNISLISESGFEHTVIDGNQADSVVTFESGEIGQISEFTIKNGKAHFWNFHGGGGIYCDNNSCPDIHMNFITENHSEMQGGGISCRNGSSPNIYWNFICYNQAPMGGGINCVQDASPIIAHNEIYNNVAKGPGQQSGSGGGINCNSNASPWIFDNAIIYNTTVRFGGGIACGDSESIIYSNKIAHNTSSYYGGGVSIGGIPPQFHNNFVFENSADQDGGGIYVVNTAFARIMNNNIVNNSALHGGGIAFRAAYMEDPALHVTNNILWGNSASKGKEIWGAAEGMVMPTFT